MVTVLSGGNITMGETIGVGPYAIEFTEESDSSLTPDDIGAANKDLSNVPVGAVTAEKLADDVTGETICVKSDKKITLAEAVSPLGGATTPQTALAMLGAGVRPNELDNAYFVGGSTGWGVFPVNQRGVSGTISTPGYFIDRWKLVSGTVQITAAGLVLNGTIAQILPSSIGSVCTATALTTTGIVTCQYDDASRTFTITGTEQTFVFAKLERGGGQTAAYQNTDGAWQQLPQPDSDYAIQLAQCRMYFIRCNNAASIAGVAYIQTEFVFTVPITEMRTVPAISNVSCNGIVTQSGIIIPASALSFSVLRIGASGCVIRIDSTQNAEVGPAVLLDFSADFTAEL